MKQKTMNIEFTSEEVLQILEEYYGESEIEEFSLEVWTVEEVRVAILNR